MLTYSSLMDETDVPNVTLPESADDPKYDLMRGVQELEGACPQYTKAQLYYDGRVSEWHANPNVARQLEQSSVGYPFRLAAVPVDTLVDRIQLTRILVDEGAQEAFDEAWEANDMESWAIHQHWRTFLYGDAYLRVWPASDDPEDNETPDRVKKAGLKYTYLSPFSTRVIYSTEDGKTPLFAIQRWQDGRRLRADVIYPDHLVRWRTARDNDPGHAPLAWEPHSAEGEEHEEALPDSIVGELPIKHSRLGLNYGAPAHEAAYGPANAIMKHLVTQLATVDTQGWPVRLLLTDPAAVLDQTTDQPDWDDDANHGIDGDQPAVVPSQLREAPGVMQILEGIKQAHTFEAADPDNLINPVLKMYLPIMSVTTRTPMYEFDPSSGDQPSGKARQTKDGPFRAKAERIKRLLTDFWEEVAKLSMRILENEIEQTEVGYISHGIASSKEDWEVIHMQLTAGVPFEVVMTQVAGYDPATVREWEPPVLGGKTEGVSDNPGPQSGGETGAPGNPTKLGTSIKAQEGPS